MLSCDVDADLLCSPPSPSLWTPLQVTVRFNKRKSSTLPYSRVTAGGGVPKDMAAKVGMRCTTWRPATSGGQGAGMKAEGARPRFFVGHGGRGSVHEGSSAVLHGQYKDGKRAESMLQRARARDKEISGEFPDLRSSKENEEREHVYDRISDRIIPGTAKPDGRKLLEDMRICMDANKSVVPLQQLLSREVTKGETAMEVERNMRRGGSKPSMLNLASASLQALPRNLSEIQKRMERASAEANERLMARLKQGSSALHAAREEELLSQVVIGRPGGGCKCRE